MDFQYSNSARATVGAIRRLTHGEDKSIGELGRRAFESFFPPHPQTGNIRLTHLVLQGGGTLGIAHLGFLYGLEQAGVRFVGTAGTSAGAIVALMLAAAEAEPVSVPARAGNFRLR
jgi:predicted acylesterase/phospholipase RssA